MSKVLVVFGATGQQGGSVVDAVLTDPNLRTQFKVRGTTRDTGTPKAQELTAKGVEVVRADIDDHTSLRTAFDKAHTVFASTVTIYDGHAYEHEVAHGRALADVAVAAGVKQYIYSTLPNAGQISGGKLKHMGHFDGKEEAEQYIRKLPMRSAFVAPGSFMSNFHASMAPRPIGDDLYAVVNFVAPSTQMPLIDAAHDTGKWVAAILADFDRYEANVLCCATALYSFEEITNAMSRATGKTVVYKQLPEEVWRGFLLPTMRDHFAEMMHYFQDYGYYGKDTGSKVA